MASLVEDNAQSINVNDNQGFTEWLVNQPGTNGSGRLGYRGAECLKANGDQMMHYAKQYAEQHQSALTSNWNHNLADSKEAINSRYHEYQQGIPKETTIGARHATGQRQIRERGAQQGLAPNHMVDKTAVSQVENLFHEDHAKLDQGKISISQQGNAETSKVSAEQSRKRHGSLIHDMAHNLDTKDHV